MELKFTTKTNQIRENEKTEQNTPKLQEIIIFNTLKSNFALLSQQIAPAPKKGRLRVFDLLRQQRILRSSTNVRA